MPRDPKDGMYGRLHERFGLCGSEKILPDGESKPDPLVCLLTQVTGLLIQKPQTTSILVLLPIPPASALKMEVAGFFEMLITTYEITHS
jgi:hypothetical protein